MLLERIAPIVFLVFLAFWIYWYYRITKRIAPKIWGFIYIIYHVLVIYLFTLRGQVENIAIGVYIITPFVFGIVWGIEKIIKTNFSVNLFEWFGVSKNIVEVTSAEESFMGNVNIGDADILKKRKRYNAFNPIAVLIPVFLVLLIIVVTCIFSVNTNEKNTPQIIMAVDSVKLNTQNSSDTQERNTGSVNGYEY